MSVKSLRGSRMEDVIFNGTSQRAAANCATVTLVIDTEEEYNKAQHQTIEAAAEGETAKQTRSFSLDDQPEVTVSRKYYRSGESEYYINKKQVRLKDIYELFYDTGIGREGYSVIGQGKIAEVLSQKDEERRSIFEEAAGISKFRYKKLEAERKLRDTENNLVRINDILSEIGSRIGPLAKEAENARQYLGLNEEKKGLEITLWLDRIDYLRARRVECETELAAARLALETAERAAAECETATDRMLNESYEFGRVMSECERMRSESVQKKSEAEGRIAVCENDIAHAEEALASNRELIGSAESECKLAEEAQEALVQAESAAKAELASAESGCTAAEEAYSAAHEETQKFDSESEKSSGAMEVLTAEKSALSARAAAARASLEAQQRAESENSGRIAAGDARIKELESAAAEINEKLASAEAEIAKAADESAKFAEEAKETEKLVSENAEEINALKLSLGTLTEKRDQLLRLEQLLEGYSDSVKRVLNDCASGKITDKGRKIGICGTVSNIISSDSEYVIALETALAASVQFIVVEKESDAKACIRYLKENKLGRATFLPLESVQGRLFDDSQIKNMPGYIGLASGLAKYEKKYEGAVNDLLGRTVIADSIDNAAAIARSTGFRVKTVTLDGQVINAGGSYTGGSVHGKVGVFTRAMDIERISEQIKAAQGGLDSLADKRVLLESKAASLEAQRAGAETKAAGSAAECAKLRLELQSYEVRIEEERSHVRSISGAEDAVERLQTELQGIESELAVLEGSLEKAAAERESARSKAETARQEEANAFAALGEARVALYEKRNSLAVAAERREVGSARIAELKARAELGRNSVEKANELISGRLAEIGKLKAECGECDSDISACEERIKQLVAGREEKEKEINEMRAKQKLADSDKENAFRAVTGCESRRDSVNGEYDTVSGKLWDEYELTYSDAEKYRLPPEKMDKAPSRLASLRAKIRSMGTINVNAVEEYAATKQRFDFLTEQTEDLNKTRASLDRTISKLSSGMKETFLEYFDKINVEFNNVFCELFGGGSARLELTDPMMPLECGIEIILKVPGKSVRSISLLSGGEQSFAAISLYLALQRVNPAPFCVFDEIESALDEVNVGKFASYVRRNSDKTQYIIITHRRGTMEYADTLYGITMSQKGVSDHMRLNLAKLDERFRENIN